MFFSFLFYLFHINFIEAIYFSSPSSSSSASSSSFSVPDQMKQKFEGVRSNEATICSSFTIAIFSFGGSPTPIQFFDFLFLSGSKVTPKNFIMYPQGCVDVKRGALQFASMTLICCGCCYPFVYVCLVLVRRMDQQLFVCLFDQLLRKTPSKNVYTYTYVHMWVHMYVLVYGYSPVVYMMLDITLDTHICIIMTTTMFMLLWVCSYIQHNKVECVYTILFVQILLGSLYLNV